MLGPLELRPLEILNLSELLPLLLPAAAPADQPVSDNF